MYTERDVHNRSKRAKQVTNRMSETCLQPHFVKEKGGGQRQNGFQCFAVGDAYLVRDVFGAENGGVLIDREVEVAFVRFEFLLHGFVQVAAH